MLPMGYGAAWVQLHSDWEMDYMGRLEVKKLSYFYYWIKAKYGLVDELWPARAEPCFCAILMCLFVTGANARKAINRKVLVLVDYYDTT